MKYIYTQLKGGLGNQLFIYSHAKSLALSQNRKLILDIHSGFANDHKYNRTYELEKFSVTPDFIIKDSTSLFSYKILKKISKWVSKILPNKYKFFIEESNLAFNSKVSSYGAMQNHLYIDGYWQSEEYFSSYRNLIFRELDSSPVLNEQIDKISINIKKSNSISVHIRKFVDHVSDLPNNLDVDYYRKAFETIDSQVSNPIYYIFSEPGAINAEVKDYFKSRNSIFINDIADNISAEIDFHMMKECKHHIIANSTFGWWAAWMGEQGNQHAIIIAPKIYINDGPASWGFDGLIPERWISL